MTKHNDLAGAVFAQSPCGILILDDTGKITSLNRTLAELVGLSTEQLMGHDSKTLPFSTHRELLTESGLIHLTGPGVVDERWLECSAQENGDGGVVKFFLDVTEQIVLEDENARLRQQVKQLTLTDELTGLANDQELSRALNAQITRSRRYGNPLSLVMMEVFDEQSPEELLSDALILATSRYLRDRLRWVDVIARWEQNQFVIILPETTHSDGHTLISKIQDEFPEIQEKETLALRFGLAEWQKGNDSRLLMRRAAMALSGEQEQMEQAS